MTGLSREKLGKLRAPEQLDRAIVITSSRAWLAVLLLGVILAALVIWSVWGSLTTRVVGLGIVLPTDGRVYSVYSENGGEVQSVNVRAGEVVQPGQTLMVLKRGTDVRDITAEKSRVEDLRKEYEDDKSAADLLIEERQQNYDKLVASLNGKVKTLTTRLREEEGALGDLEQDLQSGYVTRDVVDQAKSAIDDLRFQIVDLGQQLIDAEISVAEFIADKNKALEAQLWEVENAEIELTELIANSRQDQQIVAEVAGVVEEVAVAPGSRLGAWELAFEILAGDGELGVESFFRQSDGKRIVPGMNVNVALSSADASIYGTAIGTVTEVSELPVTQEFIRNLMGNEQLAQEMTADGAPIHVRVKLNSDPSTTSGLAWSSSSGPPFKIAYGTSASPTVTVESEAPINYVAPFLPENIGLALGNNE